MRILGLSGRKESGKDSFARCVIRHNPAFVRIGFADKLKAICREIFGLTENQTDHMKETPLSVPVELDDHISVLSDKLQLPIERRGLSAKTPRQILQYVGTDYVRSIRPNYWVDSVIDQVNSDPSKKYVITDVRFPNEADRIREVSGFVLRVVRLSQASKSPEHVSEELDFSPDATMAVMENNWTLPTYIARNVSPGFFKFYDWYDLQKLFALKDWWSHYCNDLERFAVFYYGAALIDEDS